MIRLLDNNGELVTKMTERFCISNEKIYKESCKSRVIRNGGNSVVISYSPNPPSPFLASLNGPEHE